MKRIIVPVVSGFEEMELSIITSMLRQFKFEVDLVSLENVLEIAGAHDISIICDKLFENINTYEQYDCIILVGGTPGADNLCADISLIECIKDFNNKNKIIGAICAGPIVLREAEIIFDRKITSYPGFFDVRENINYQVDMVVKDGNVITSRSQSTAFEFAMEIAISLNVNKNEINEFKEKSLYNSFIKWVREERGSIDESYIGVFS